jgi:rhamnose transport system permease protein
MRRRISVDQIVNVVLRFREAGIIIFLVAVLAIFTAIEPRFFQTQNFQGILADMAVVLVVASGQTLVVITRNVDLSVGSIVGVAVMGTATFLVQHPGLPLPLIFLMGIAIGALLGAVNGFIIAFFEVPSIVATLGTLGLYRGLAYWVSNSVQVDPNQLPKSLLSLSNADVAVAWLVYIALVVSAVMAFVLRFSRFGRRCYALGDNPRAAALRGIPAGWTTFWAFVASGALAGLAGIMYIGQFGTANPADAGVGLELRSVAAVVIGGASLFGGYGRQLGTVLGALLLAMVTNGLYITNVSAYWDDAFIGSAILVAVVVDGALRRRATLIAQQARRHR